VTKRTKRILLVIGAIFGVLVALRIVAAFIWPTINDVRTSATPEYPDIVVQRFQRPADQVFTAALAVAEEMKLEVISKSPEKGLIQAVATTQIFRFKDDVTILIRQGPAGALVDIRSHSRIGKGDLGANARRIRDFQARLAKRLQA
jgi:uncharacterized protein (DUF1499 family)